mgnify:CR=1 FL=1
MPTRSRSTEADPAAVPGPAAWWQRLLGGRPRQRAGPALWQIVSLQNDGELFCQLANEIGALASRGGRFQQGRLERLPPLLRGLFSLAHVDKALGEGGFHRAFWQGYLAYVPYALEALDMLQLRRHGALLAEAIQVYICHEARIHQLARQGDFQAFARCAELRAFEPLSMAYAALAAQAPLAAEVARYARAHTRQLAALWA